MNKEPLLSEQEALARVLAEIGAPVPSRLTLSEALGRFSLRELRATVPLPGFDNSSMDGYALAVPDNGELPAGTVLRVSGEQPAGLERGLCVGEGQAARIFTGAPLPEGAAAVVMQEDVRREGETITLNDTVQHGDFIRRAGSDLCAGQRLIGAGEKLTAPALALLASQGLVDVQVGAPPRVAILTTGDELRAPGSGLLRPGEIYESNGTLLAGLSAGIVGQASVRRLGHAPDDASALDALLRQGLAESDVLVIAGGVSVGERDLVRARLKAAGARLHLWRVRVRPGKPFAYGRGPGGTHIFGLPGNPVSAFMTFLLFARPALLKLLGAADAELPLPSVPAIAGVEMANESDRPHYVRGNVDVDARFIPAGAQESHALAGLSRSRALVRLEESSRVPAGAPLRALSWM